MKNIKLKANITQRHNTLITSNSFNNLELGDIEEIIKTHRGRITSKKVSDFTFKSDKEK